MTRDRLILTDSPKLSLRDALLSKGVETCVTVHLAPDESDRCSLKAVNLTSL